MNPIQGKALPTSGIRSFGYQRSPTHKHNGIDIPATLGASVRAADAGIVVHSSEVWEPGFTGYGRHIVIAHHDSPLHTLYAHLDRSFVGKGQVVQAGEVIGTVGVTEFAAPDHVSTFEPGRAHLHFEIAARAYPMESTADRLDPIAYLASLDQGHEGIATVDRPFDLAQPSLSSSQALPHCPTCTCSKLGDKT